MVKLENFDFDSLLASRELYENEKKKLSDRILANYAMRKEPAEVTIAGEILEVTYGYVILNLFMINSYVESGIEITKDDLFNYPTVTQKSLEEYFNGILERFEGTGKEAIDHVRETIYQTLNETSDASSEYNRREGNGISYTDFVKLAVTDPEAYELMHPQIKEGQYSFIEKQFNEEGDKLMKYFASHENTELYPYAASNTGINKKQLTQALGMVALKPSIDGHVIPVLIKDNFINGLKSLENYYINACGTRLALITNNKYVRRSGYLTRKLSLANIDHYHDNSIEDCGTKHYVIYDVSNARKLRQIIGRHYYDIDDSGNKKSDELHTVTKRSMELIGKKIGLRSPITCCGKHVCATCYGRHLSEVNKDVNSGMIAVYKLTEPLTQRLLSAKHLLSTKTDNVDWGEEFPDYFDVNMDSVYTISDVDFEVSIPKPSPDAYDEDEEKYWVSKLIISPKDAKKDIEYNSPMKLYVNPKLMTQQVIKSEEPIIKLDQSLLKDDEWIFKYHPKNNELTKSLQQILDLIESNDHLGISDYSEFVNKFDDLLIENDMDSINSVHIEMLSSTLIKGAVTGKPVDFSKDEVEPYVINRVSKSVMQGPLATRLAFERINDQLVDLETYDETETSMMDYLFH